MCIGGMRSDMCSLYSNRVAEGYGISFQWAVIGTQLREGKKERERERKNCYISSKRMMGQARERVIQRYEIESSCSSTGGTS